MSICIHAAEIHSRSGKVLGSRYFFCKWKQQYNVHKNESFILLFTWNSALFNNSCRKYLKLSPLCSKISKKLILCTIIHVPCIGPPNCSTCNLLMRSRASFLMCLCSGSMASVRRSSSCSLAYQGLNVLVFNHQIQGSPCKIISPRNTKKKFAKPRKIFHHEGRISPKSPKKGRTNA